MPRLNLREISISPHGIREGVLLAYERFGENWLERVNEEDSTSNYYENASIQQALHPYEPISRRGGGGRDARLGITVLPPTFDHSYHIFTKHIHYYNYHQ